jgi:putative transposase
MTRFLHPLLLLIAKFTNKELAHLVEYLLTENRCLRSKLPKRIEVTPAERAKLVKLGKPLGSKLKDIISIVSYRTFQRWANEERPKAKPVKPGRPRKPEEIRELIIQMAKDTGWGYRRILGELKKLRIKVSRATVARILKENGFDLGPKRGKGTWSEFVKLHMKTLWATDFFTQTVWTLRGPVVYYVLFFIHIETRRVHLAGMTPHPDGVWMAQQARNLSMFFDEQGETKPTHIIRDRDTKFTAEFCSILECDGIEFRPIPPRSPNLNPHSEAWVQRTKHEVLNHFLVFGERHLRYILSSWIQYYHEFRPHQGLGNVLLDERDKSPPELSDVVPLGTISCYELLGGLLKHYVRKAA